MKNTKNSASKNFGRQIFAEKDFQSKCYMVTGNSMDISSIFTSLREESGGVAIICFDGNLYIEIDSNSPNKKTLVMLKDSYSNALIPWLTCAYSKIIVVDARTFDQSITKILNTTPVDDFLITNYILGTNFRDYIKLCHDIY